jgi:MtN3 and saliva related transmembrane protein
MEVFWRLFTEIGFSLSLTANALLFVPQAIKLYRAKSAKGVSFLTFFGFNIIQIFAGLHAYFANDGILLVGNIFALITCGVVAALAYLYRNY